jgi:LysM repeat protein
MTSDAKIGLLIGLVFIVIIAFLINGLPELIGDGSTEGIINTSVNNDRYQSILIDHNVTKAVAPLNDASVAGNTQESHSPLQLQRLEQYRDAQGQLEQSQRLVNYQDTGRVRYVTNVPGASNKSIGPIKKSLPQKAVNVSAVEKVDAAAADEQAFKGTDYEVQSGDNLAVIATKFYGSEIGNKKAIVDKLYHVNSDTLESPGMLYVGQKLYIPSLKELAEGGGEKGIFSKMKEAAGKTIKDIREAISGSDNYETYTVEEGDSLWLIAEKMLGDGKRYTDIAAANDLDDEDTITAGTELKIPKE